MPHFVCDSPLVASNSSVQLLYRDCSEILPNPYPPIATTALGGCMLYLYPSLKHSTHPEEEHMNPVVHFEMPYESGDRAAKFYQSAFGWQMQNMGAEMGN